MAEAKKKGGNPITKKAGPLPLWGWFAVAGGTYVIYRYLKARSAANAATAASGLTGGNLIPNDIGLPSTSSAPSGAGTFSSVSTWTQAALDFMTQNGLDAGTALNQITAYLNGNCVSQAGYNALSAAFANSSIGLPPAAFNSANLPTLSVCPAPQQTPTPSNPAPAPAPAVPTTPIFGGLSAALQNQLARNGESIAATAWDPVLNEFILLTNKGGIYNVNAQGTPSGGAFYGSYLGLPSNLRATVPGQVRNFTQLTINPDGTYTAIDSAGESYTFTPSTPQAA